MTERRRRLAKILLPVILAASAVAIWRAWDVWDRAADEARFEALDAKQEAAYARSRALMKAANGDLRACWDELQQVQYLTPVESLEFGRLRKRLGREIVPPD
jgi:hypothetical protein